MTPDPIAAVQAATGAALPAIPSVELGWGASLTDFGAFERALQRMEQVQRVRETQPNAAVEAVFRPLEHLNGEAAALSVDANQAAEAGRALTPGELVNLTVRCQEFMFHCQLASNIANRTSDGLQQLFRQQS